MSNLVGIKIFSYSSLSVSYIEKKKKKTGESLHYFQEDQEDHAHQESQQYPVKCQ